MKAIKAIRVAGGVLVFLAAINAHAQSSDVDMASQLSSKTTAKTARSADRILAKKVRTALSKTKDIDVANITVRAKTGVVTLQGTVPDQVQIDRAGQVARGVSGVTSVNVLLGIRPVDY
ncbi:BON domain-containing protein [Paraburkholderia tropica]|uniref:BON domain-containing protein n=1 Tax=Paraburkholderia tropica TaxID=92647 RepID=UPI002AB69E7D|nr:BON domain-containing protein [Paraburkholderia tropica]